MIGMKELSRVLYEVNLSIFTVSWLARVGVLVLAC